MSAIWDLFTGQLGKNEPATVITEEELEAAGYTIQYEGNLFTGYYPISATPPCGSNLPPLTADDR